MPPRIQTLQHVPFEGLGSMAQDFKAHGCTIATTHWYRGDQAPELESFDWLVVMGGPMGVYDHAQYPWLHPEKALIKAAIEANKVMLGVCLGAQLIASALGATVSRNGYREIGWFPIERQPNADHSPLRDILPNNIEVFHWHGDTFELPEGALLLASSHACRHQAFSVGERVFGFQFHLEATPDSARALVEHCSDELDNSEFVQSKIQILEQSENFEAINQLMSQILSRLFEISEK